jgi:4-amino-4-deoxy-L-arabinose transferase-like glycosyltransferase
MQVTVSHLSYARRALAILFTFLAIGLMISSAYLFRPTPTPRELIPQAVLAFALGVMALGIAVLLARNTPDTLRPTSTAMNGRTHWLLLITGIAALALVAEISGSRFALPWLAGVSFNIQFALLLVGILLVGWGLGGGLRRWAAVEWRNVVAMTAIMLLGLGVRLWGIDTTLRFMMDETVFTDAMLELPGNPDLMNGGGKSTFTQVYPYWNAGTVALLGNNLVGLRLASILIGVMTIPAIYGLARALFDNRLALAAALIAATFPPNVHFSRISWGHMGDQLFGVMALMFAARALAHNRRLDWAFAGVSLGLTQFFYEVGRLLFPPLFILWGVWLAICWNLRAQRRGLVIAGVAAVLVAAPIYYSVAVRGMPFTPRLNESGRDFNMLLRVFDRDAPEHERHQLVAQWMNPFLVYTHTPDALAEYYGGQYGFVPPAVIPLFLLGVAWLLLRLRYPAFVLLLALALVSAANVLANDSAIAARYVAMLGVIPIIIALGLRTVLRLLSIDRVKSLWLVSAVLIAAFQVYFYFGVHLPYYNEQRRRTIPERDLFDAILLTPTLPRNTEMYILDGFQFIDYGRASRLRDYVSGTPATPPMYPLQAPPLASFDPALLPRDRNYAFFVAPGDEVTQRKIQEAFPDVQPPRYSPYAIPAWDEYILLYWQMERTAVRP